MQPGFAVPIESGAGHSIAYGNTRTQLSPGARGEAGLARSAAGGGCSDERQPNDLPWGVTKPTRHGIHPGLRDHTRTRLHAGESDAV